MGARYAPGALKAAENGWIAPRPTHGQFAWRATEGARPAVTDDRPVSQRGSAVKKVGSSRKRVERRLGR